MNSFNLRILILLSLLFIFESAMVHAGSFSKGNCPSLKEVRVDWHIETTSQPGGGWKFDKFIMRESGTARADELWHCNARKSPSSNKYDNEIICTYFIDFEDNPQPAIVVKKKKPSNYDCDCDSETGKYRCNVK